MSRSAVAGGALLAMAGATGLTIAQEDDGEDGTGGNESEPAAFENVDGTDVEVLNYALTLEHLEDAFYQEGLDTFGEQDFVDAVEGGPESQGALAYDYVGTIAEHESAHVDVLTQAVELLGGTPAEPTTTEFGFESVQEMVELGQVLENTGVAAYAGVAPWIESPDLLRTALSIHSVEARHAAIFNWLVGDSPFPNAFDPALPPADVLDAVAEYLETVPEDMHDFDGDVTDGPENVTDGMDGNATDGADGNVTDGTNGNVTDGADGNVTDGTNGNVTDGTNGNVTDGTNGNVTDGTNGNVTDGTNGNVTDGANGNVTDGTGTNGNATGGTNGNATNGNTTGS